MDWYLLAITALFGKGIERFLYKVSAEKKCNAAWTTFAFMLTVTILSTILFFISDESVDDFRYLLILSLINASSFLVMTISTIEALKRLATSVVYPVIRSGGVLVIIFSILYFKDAISLSQVVGMLIAISMVLILTTEENGAKVSHNKGFGRFLVFLALLTQGISTISCKFAAISVNTLAFIAISYLYNTVLSFGLRKKLQTEDENPKQTNALIIGVFIGFANFIGFYAQLKALSVGPLSIITSILSLSFIIPVGLSILIYREKLTRRRVLGLILAIATVILLKGK